MGYQCCGLWQGQILAQLNSYKMVETLKAKKTRTAGALAGDIFHAEYRKKVTVKIFNIEMSTVVAKIFSRFFFCDQY